MTEEIIMKFSDGFCLVLNDKGETNLRENDITELNMVLPPRTCEMLDKIGDMYKELKELKKVNDEKNEILAELGCPTFVCAKRLSFSLKERIKKLEKENKILRKESKEFKNFRKYLEFQEKLEDYRDCIKYSTDISQRLGFDELALLLAECIGDKQIQEETDKYVDDFYKGVKQEDKEFKELHKAIEGLVKWYNRNTAQEQ